MSSKLKWLRWWLATALLAVGILAVGWGVGRSRWGAADTSANAIRVIAPYWYNGAWVFDDPAVGLKREPFVAGVPEMIDHLVKDVPNAKDGFLLYFSAQPFPGHQKTLKWLRGDRQGNWYRLDEPPLEGWICPAMFKYYRSAPEALYVRAESKRT